MRLLAIFLIGSIHVGCAGVPKGWACVYNAHRGYNLCYNLEKDFDTNGDIKPGIKGQKVPIQSLDDMHARVNFDPDSYASLKAFILKQRYRCEEKQ